MPNNTTPNNMLNNNVPNNMLNNLMNNQNPITNQNPMQNNPITNQNPMQNLSDQNLEEMFPGLYQKLKPHIDEIANQLRNQEITENMIDSIVNEILSRSGIMDMDEFLGEDMEETENTIAVQRSYGMNPRWNRPPYYNRRRRYPRYPNLSLEDLIRLMLMRQLGRYNPYCPYCYY